MYIVLLLLSVIILKLTCTLYTLQEKNAELNYFKYSKFCYFLLKNHLHLTQLKAKILKGFFFVYAQRRQLLSNPINRRTGFHVTTLVVRLSQFFLKKYFIFFSCFLLSNFFISNELQFHHSIYCFCSLIIQSLILRVNSVRTLHTAQHMAFPIYRVFQDKNPRDDHYQCRDKFIQGRVMQG